MLKHTFFLQQFQENYPCNSVMNWKTNSLNWLSGELYTIAKLQYANEILKHYIFSTDRSILRLKEKLLKWEDGFLVMCTQHYGPLCCSVRWSIRWSIAVSLEHTTYGDWPCFKRCVLDWLADHNMTYATHFLSHKKIFATWESLK